MVVQSSSFRLGWLILSFLSLSIVSIYSVLALFQHVLIYIPRSYTKDFNYYKSLLASTKGSVIAFGQVDNEIGVDTCVNECVGVPKHSWRVLEASMLKHSRKFSGFLIARDKHVKRVYLCFGGNAQLALDWLVLLRELVEWDSTDGVVFVLIEYPGYGQTKGQKIGPNEILNATERMVREVAGYYGVSESEIKGKLSLIGHSLGCAAVLQYAAKHFSSANLKLASPNTHQVILVSPFTSLLAMANEILPFHLPFLDYFLFHPFDNIKRLEELILSYNLIGSANKLNLDLYIFHGDADEIVPVKMGQQLNQKANLFRNNVESSSLNLRVTYIEIPNGTHNDMFDEDVAGHYLREILNQK